MIIYFKLMFNFDLHLTAEATASPYNAVLLHHTMLADNY